MNDRLKKLRKALDLTQKEFGDRIGVKSNTISTYEIGRNQPIDAVISLICREFGVSENWLRTGAGEMFQQKTRDEELSAFMDDILSEEPPGFRRRMASALSRLNPSQWAALESVLTELAKELSTASAPAEMDTRPREEKPLSIDEQVELYRQQLLLEEEREKQAPSANGSGAG